MIRGQDTSSVHHARPPCLFFFFSSPRLFLFFVFPPIYIFWLGWRLVCLDICFSGKDERLHFPLLCTYTYIRTVASFFSDKTQKSPCIILPTGVCFFSLFLFLSYFFPFFFFFGTTGIYYCEKEACTRARVRVRMRACMLGSAFEMTSVLS